MKYIFMLLLFATTFLCGQERISSVCDSEEFDNEMYKNERSGDSWYDAGQKFTYNATSTLKAQGQNSYSANNIDDSNLNTAWVEGKPDYGIGEKVKVTIQPNIKEKYSLKLSGFRIANGYVKDKKTWQANSRVKALKMYINGKLKAIIELKDCYGFQNVSFNEVVIPKKSGITVELEIVDVYKGSKFQDTAISEIQFYGTGIY